MALDSAELTVGGYKFTLASNEVKQLSPQFAEELATNNNAITLDRDGQLYRHVNAFLVNGQLPRDANGQHSLDEDTLDLSKLKPISLAFHLSSKNVTQSIASTVPKTL